MGRYINTTEPLLEEDVGVRNMTLSKEEYEAEVDENAAFVAEAALENGDPESYPAPVDAVGEVVHSVLKDHRWNDNGNLSGPECGAIIEFSDVSLDKQSGWSYLLGDLPIDEALEGLAALAFRMEVMEEASARLAADWDEGRRTATADEATDEDVAQAIEDEESADADERRFSETPQKLTYDEPEN